jgi:YidC/Oxa1 family membrane protein insertase
MDRTGIIVVTLCAILLGLCFYEQQKYYSSLPRPQTGTNAPAAAQTTPANAGAAPPVSIVAPAFSFDTNTPEQTIVLTNKRARYTFTSRGGGLKLVDLLDYPETISARWKIQNTTLSTGVATLNTRAPVPVLAVLGDASLVGDGIFTLTKTDDGVRAEKSFTNGLRLVKEFHLSSNFLVNASVRLENASDKPLALPALELVVGTATPMGPDDNYYSMYGGAMWFARQPVLDVFGSGFCLFSRHAAFGICCRFEQRRLGRGAQPVFRAAGDAQTAGGGSCRASRCVAAVPQY